LIEGVSKTQGEIGENTRTKASTRGGSKIWRKNMP